MPDRTPTAYSLFIIISLGAQIIDRGLLFELYGKLAAVARVGDDDEETGRFDEANIRICLRFSNFSRGRVWMLERLGRSYFFLDIQPYGRSIESESRWQDA